MKYVFLIGGKPAIVDLTLVRVISAPEREYSKPVSVAWEVKIGKGNYRGVEWDHNSDEHLAWLDIQVSEPGVLVQYENASVELWLRSHGPGPGTTGKIMELKDLQKMVFRQRLLSMVKNNLEQAALGNQDLQYYCSLERMSRFALEHELHCDDTNSWYLMDIYGFSYELNKLKTLWHK